jgi:hypothetical protein
VYCLSFRLKRPRKPRFRSNAPRPTHHPSKSALRIVRCNPYQGPGLNCLADQQPRGSRLARRTSPCGNAAQRRERESTAERSSRKRLRNSSGGLSRIRGVFRLSNRTGIFSCDNCPYGQAGWDSLPFFVNVRRPSIGAESARLQVVAPSPRSTSAYVSLSGDSAYGT